MPYPKGHKERVRNSILESARRLFNRRGYEAVSIDDVMENAGLTRGGFYSYFKSKGELYAEAVAYVLVSHPARNWPGIDFDLTSDPARKIVNAYLSDRHFDDVEASCPLVTQASDAARGDRQVQDAYRRVLEHMAAVFMRSTREREKRTETGLAVAALCVGGLALARGVGDRNLADRIRKASRIAALELGNWQ
jgi:TetR/AcrR family transcriptional regulator, transcriptional repressor for nem operon